MNIEQVLTCEKYSPNSLATVLKKAQIFTNLTGEAILKWQWQGRLNNSGAKKVFLKIKKDPGKNGRNYIYRQDFIKFYNELLT